MTKTKQGFLWIAIYLLLVLAPLFLLLLGPTPDGRGFWRELSVAVGFAGLSIMGFQFLLTARFRHAEAPFGIDILYHFHRQITWLGMALILAHVAILAAMNPNLLRFFDLGQAPWRFWHGSLSIYLFLVLIALSLWRRLLRMGYELWRVSHGVLGTLAVVFGMAHILMMNRYVAYPPKRWLWIMLCLGWIGLLVYTRLIKPMVMTGRPYSISAVKAERNDAWTLTLKPGGHKGFRWRPGQFAWLTLGRTPYSMREHPFTMSSIPASDGSIDFTIKNLGDFTSTIGRTRPGETAYLDGPYGAFAIPDGDSGPCVFIAGGVGITPVMAMLRGLAERGDRRPLLLLYGNETWDNVIFREEIEALKGRLNLRVEHVLTSPPGGWQGRRGLIDAAMLAEVTREADWHGAHYFICGSDPMMDAVEAALTGLGVTLDRIESERYNFV